MKTSASPETPQREFAALALLAELEAALSTAKKHFSDAMQCEESDQICGFADGYQHGIEKAIAAVRRHSANEAGSAASGGEAPGRPSSSGWLGAGPG